MDTTLPQGLTYGSHVYAAPLPNDLVRAAGLNGFDYYPDPKDRVIFPVPYTGQDLRSQTAEYDGDFGEGGPSYVPAQTDRIILVNPDPKPWQHLAGTIFTVRK